MTVTANSIVTPQTPFSRQGVAVTAETSFNAPTNTITLLDRADNVNGARITRLYAIPRANIGSAVNCQVYEYDGVNKRLIDSALMSTISPSASISNAKTDFGYTDSYPFFVRAGVGLEVAIGVTVANGIVFKADGGLY